MAAKRMVDYSPWALQRELNRDGGNFQIHDYSETPYPSGYTKISYHEFMRSTTHLKYAMFSPASILIDLMIRAFQTKREHYFHTRDNVYLGKTEKEAIERANEIGEQKMREKEYGKAGSYFDIAYHMCCDFRKRSFREKVSEAENEEKAGSEEKEEDKMEQEAEERVRSGLEEIERDAKERVARNYYQQALQLWNQTFILEGSNNATYTKSKFRKCKNLFSEAAKLMPNNSLYQNWLQVLELEGKIMFKD